ncbi:flagellar basal-body MS-ring/collar protein FliF [Rhodalgimonas zhirmunskyi]|uniref:Flagellar M-ring protein n=1 Tax=Rhodalgimonas zhirmunskyi TaxID=2964767 RepID=A0AAJ1U6L4_9RHOB|nr:flagellar basal-body MS-ring/collar protein FliF [Rhodoalgimonas zhirmunskyi]MDQ2093974.1 flagellar M-ring protein FliF [Rhodoalgimonas zhirmunskyi]
MQQLLNTWSSLDIRRRIVAVLAGIALITTIIVMSRMAAQPSLTLLYSGLEPSAAGEVVQVLEQRGVAHEVRGGAIYVESGKRDELRMTLASEGLPQNNSKGYELLDTLSGFGTTAQMFDAAYWRAKEGELARTIVSSPSIVAARVHIANVGSNPFQRNVKPSASVSVTSSTGTIGVNHAKALRYLIASAVTGLAPENVSVIDGKGGLIGANEESQSGSSSDDKADKLRNRVQNLLEARVGYGNAVVEVSVETQMETESIREKSYDPAGRVAISTDTEERSNNSTETSGDDVTVASNLPDGEGGAGDNASSQNTETRERVNYEVSETHREVLRQPGAIKKISVAVLVNGVPQTGEDGQTEVLPRASAELEALRELVASAVGFDEERGDVVTIKSMAFESIALSGSEASSGFLTGLDLDFMSIIQLIILAVVALVLGVFVLRPLLKGAANGEGGVPSLPRPAASSTMSDVEEADDLLGASSLPSLTGEIADGPQNLADLPMVAGGRAQSDSGDVFANEDAPRDPTERLRNLIGERQEETVEILRNWLENREEKA